MKGNGDTPTLKARVKELHDLAKKLRLTEKMRKFSEVIAGDPDKNKSAAARAAGAPKKSAGQMGQKWFNLDKVQVYIGALLNQGGCQSEAMTGSTVLQIAESEAILSYQTRGNMGMFIDVEGEGTDSYPVFNFDQAKKDGHFNLIKKLKIKRGFSPEGLPWTETDLELVDGQRSHDMWLKIHGLYKETARPENANDALWASVLAKMPGEMLRALEQAQLRGHQTIDVPFKITAGNGDGKCE